MVFLLGLFDCRQHTLFGRQGDGAPRARKVQLSRAVFRPTFRLFRLMIVRCLLSRHMALPWLSMRPYP